MDIIEADAQQREEELHKWWQENWKNIAGGVVLAIALITGMYMYRDYNQKKMYENAGDFYSNVISVNMADAEGVEKVNSFISAHNKDVYSQLAALSLAKQLVSEKKYQEAVDVLSKTVGAGKDTVIDDITRMRIARLNIELKKFDEAEKAIDSLSAKNAEAFDDALQDMRGTINSVKISVMQELFPTFTEMFKTIQAFVKDNGPKIREQVGFVVGSVGNIVKGLLPSIPKILNVVVKLVDLIGPGVLAALAGFTGILGVVVPLVPSLMAAASVISGPIVAGVGLAVVGFVAWKKAISSVIDNFDMLKSFIYDDIGGAIKNFANQFVEVAKWMWGGFKMFFVDPWFEFFDALPNLIKSAVSGVKGFLNDFPIIGNFFDGAEVGEAASAPSLGSSVAQTVSESRTTTTSRFSVDFKNMPKGVQVTPPAQGDFDWSRGYVLGGV